MQTFFFFYKIKYPEDCIEKQNSILKLVDWCKMVGLSLNYEQFNVMPFFRTRNKINFDYLINNKLLPLINHLENIGFTLVPSIYFSNHVEFITCKALRILSFIYRNASDFNQSNYIFTLYTSLVRSILEHGSVL
jgi:hypothetical protein